ncbi:MAG: RiPP maturation radical SAM C-methyltransferase [Syntrophales bacterium]
MNTHRDMQEDAVKSVPVILVVPPFFPCQMPSIATGILKASLSRIDILCKVVYANILFAEVIGLQRYFTLANHIFQNRTNLQGERLFAASAHGITGKPMLVSDIPPYMKEFYDFIGGAKEPPSQSEHSRLEAECAGFIKRAASEISFLKPKIIGFSCSMQQINSSISLAQEIKKNLPDVICVIGGKNCDGEMGEEIAASIKIFDFVFQGEADFTFSLFCRSYLKDNVLPDEKLIKCETPLDLDQIPSPDYADYMEQFLHEMREYSSITFESSRGCWWGQLNRCKFCADTGASIKYRSKSPTKVVEELCDFQEKYPEFNNFLATDSIFPQIYFKDFFNKLSESGFSGNIAYEVKANLTFDQLSVMKKARISLIDPGMESLSTRLLQLMSKGCTAASNIRMLRDCRELNISPFWHLLVCIPGDRVSDYEEQIRLIPLIHHLHPPVMSPIIIQRFSPYFEDPGTYGVTDIRPVAGYKHAFPGSVDITRLGYYFEARFPSEVREEPDIINLLAKELIKWFKCWQGGNDPGLWIKRTGDNQWSITDTRECLSERVTTLNSREYSFLRKYRIPQYQDGEKDKNLIESFIKLGFLIEVDEMLLSVLCDLDVRKQYDY